MYDTEVLEWAEKDPLSFGACTDNDHQTALNLVDPTRIPLRNGFNQREAKRVISSVMMHSLRHIVNGVLLNEAPCVVMMLDDLGLVPAILCQKTNTIGWCG